MNCSKGHDQLKHKKLFLYIVIQINIHITFPCQVHQFIVIVIMHACCLRLHISLAISQSVSFLDLVNCYYNVEMIWVKLTPIHEEPIAKFLNSCRIHTTKQFKTTGIFLLALPMSSRNM